MTQYIRYKNNDIELESWATSTLSAEELVQFRSAEEANKNLWESYRNRGFYTVQNVYETAYSADLNINVEVLVGQKIIMSPGRDLHSLDQDPNYKFWVQRFESESGKNISVLEIE